MFLETVITTFSKDGYDLYGKKMIETWLEFWPRKYYRLVVYTENFKIDDERFEQRDIHQCCPEIVKFKHISDEMINKSICGKEIKKIQKTVKWSHKVFAMDHALKNCDTKYLIYLDGDTYSFDSAPTSLGENLCEDYLFATHFETLIHGPHFETGLIIYNTEHERFNEFINLYVDGYVSLKIYDLNKTWDSYWLYHLYEENEFPVKNLANKSSKVFNNEIIKEFLVHDVGPKKYRNTNYDRYTGRKK